MQTKVSVVIPCYNYGEYLAEAVESVLASGYDNLEIIIVDDGSDDRETIELLDNFSRPNTRIIRQPHHGVVSARNNGIQEASGEYILPLDADDMIVPEFIRRAAAVLDANPDIGIVYSDYQYIGDRNTVAHAPVWDSLRLLYENLLINSSFFRKKDWERVGGYKKEMEQGYEDWEFWISLSEIGVTGYRIPEPFVYYRIHGDSRNTAANQNFSDIYLQIMKLHAVTYVENILYIIFPVLLKLMPYIPVGIKMTYTKKLFKNAFLSKNVFKNITSIFKYLIKRLLTCNSGGALNSMPAFVLPDGCQLNSQPLISVIIPVYNVAGYLPQCLDSVIRQSFSNIEIICIDDATEDNSVEILKDYASKDARIKIIHNAENMGLGLTRNVGLSVARGEYVHFVDSDDWVRTDLYEKMNDIINKFHPQIINFSYIEYDERKKCFREELYYKGIDNVDGCFKPVDNPEFVNNAEAVWKCLYSRKFLNENNIIFTDVPIHEDTPFYIECLLKADKLYAIQDIFYYYRINRPKSLINLRFKYFDAYFEWYNLVDKLVAGYDEEIYRAVVNRLCSSFIDSYNYLILNNIITAARYYKRVKEFSIQKKFEIYMPDYFMYYVNELQHRPFVLYAFKEILRKKVPWLLNGLVKIKKMIIK